jgi:UDP-GlcNAc:undecaprenyl-phosphate GlcNAc-1-phosphate transferase
MAIPLLDTALAISRRFLRGQAIFAADRGHIHHRLLARGFTARRIAYILYASAGLLAALSLLMSNSYFGGGVIVAFCAVIWLAVRYLGYEEFDVARRMVFGGFFRRLLNANVCVAQFEQAVQSARTVDECWAALLDSSRVFGLSVVTLRLPGREFTATLVEASPEECWSLTTPLEGAGCVDLSLPCGPDHSLSTIAPLCKSLRTALAPKLAQFQSEALSRAEAVAFSN